MSSEIFLRYPGKEIPSTSRCLKEYWKEYWNNRDNMRNRHQPSNKNNITCLVFAIYCEEPWQKFVFYLHLFQTGILLESYETISKVTLDIAIVQHHDNSRVRDLPTTDLGSVLCYMKRLLLTTDIRPSVTAHTVTLEPKNIEQMVPYTCQTLKTAFHVLRQVKSDILETFYSRFRWIFKSFSNEVNTLWSTKTI